MCVLVKDSAGAENGRPHSPRHRVVVISVGLLFGVWSEVRVQVRFASMLPVERPFFPTGLPGWCLWQKPSVHDADVLLGLLFH